MSQEKFNLNWNSYTDHLREMLQEMMKTTELTDVTLVCDDKRQFKAHKIVLSACSTVFKSIINELPQNSSVIYLRGIQHQEMKSILEFIYLGAATFYQERMNEFLNVAKNLEIKEINKDVKFHYDNVFNEEPEVPGNEEHVEEDTELQTNTSENRKTDGRFYCGKCESSYTYKPDLIKHIKSKHEGAIFPCNQCDQQYTVQKYLAIHFRSKHEGVKYDCNQCDQQFSLRSNLAKHIKTQHEGVKYDCNQCDYQATRKYILTSHKKLKH